MDDAEWFTVMYRQHYDDVARYLRRRAPDLEVPDVVASVFLTAWRRIQDVPRRAPLPWLYGVANNTLANEIRSKQRRQLLHDRVRVAASTEGADHSGQVVNRLILLKMLDDLPDDDREILRLIAWEGLSVSDAAKVIGRTRTAVAMRILRLRRRLASPAMAPRPDT